MRFANRIRIVCIGFNFGRKRPMTTLPGTAVGGPDNTSWTPANDGSCSQTQHSQLEGDYLADPAASNFDSSNTVDPAEDIFTSKKKVSFCSL